MGHIKWAVDQRLWINCSARNILALSRRWHHPPIYLHFRCKKIHTHTKYSHSTKSQMSVFFWHRSVFHVYIPTEYDVRYNFVLLLLDRNINIYKSSSSGNKSFNTRKYWATDKWRKFALDEKRRIFNFSVWSSMVSVTILL